MFQKVTVFLFLYFYLINKLSGYKGLIPASILMQEAKESFAYHQQEYIFSFCQNPFITLNISLCNCMKNQFSSDSRHCLNNLVKQQIVA